MQGKGASSHVDDSAVNAVIVIMDKVHASPEKCFKVDKAIS